MNTRSEAAQIAGRRVLVTGGSKGIGRAIVQRLAERGANIVTCARDERVLIEAVKECGQLAGAVHGLMANIADVPDIDRLFAFVDETLGGLDILVANAAIGGKGFAALSDAEAAQMLAINLGGHLFCAKRALDRMQTAGGHIVIIGSMSADVRGPDETLYATAKAGLQAFAEALRKDVNTIGVHVTLIEPGAVNTPMQEKSRIEKDDACARLEMMEPEDVADCVEFALTRPNRCDVVSIQIRPHRQLI